MPRRSLSDLPSARGAELGNMLVLDSGAVSRLAERTRAAAALLRALREEGLWPPLVPSVVLVECLQGHAGNDANANRFLKTCDISEELRESVARRAAFLRRRARKGQRSMPLSLLTPSPARLF